MNRLSRSPQIRLFSRFHDNRDVEYPMQLYVQEKMYRDCQER
jgi:hypothetical protein